MNSHEGFDNSVAKGFPASVLFDNPLDSLMPRDSDDSSKDLKKLLEAYVRVHFMGAGSVGGSSSGGSTEAQQVTLNSGVSDLNNKLTSVISEVTAAKDAVTNGSTQSHTDLLALLSQLQTQFSAVDGIENLLTSNGGELLLIRQNVANTLGAINQFRTDNSNALSNLNTSTQQVLSALPTQTNAIVAAIQGLFDVEIDIGTSTVVAPATEARLIERSIAINKTTQSRGNPIYREVNTGALITDGTVFDTSLTEEQQIQYHKSEVEYAGSNIPFPLTFTRVRYWKLNGTNPMTLVSDTWFDVNGSIISEPPNKTIKVDSTKVVAQATRWGRLLLTGTETGFTSKFPIQPIASQIPLDDIFEMTVTLVKQGDPNAQVGLDSFQGGTHLFTKEGESVVIKRGHNLAPISSSGASQIRAFALRTAAGTTNELEIHYTYGTRL